MNKDQIHDLYDEKYADSYNDKFISSALARHESEHEERLLGKLLQPGMRWLDVACGTGHFLSRFPDYKREGLDLSAAMLRRAREANPSVVFHEGSFLDAHDEWENGWDLVSCMWYAYGLVDTLDEVSRLISNLAKWTSPRGKCFIPLADPRLIAGAALPFKAEYPMSGSHIQVSAVIWSFIEDNGNKIHHHQLAPSLEWMTTELGKHFHSIMIEKYPNPRRMRSRLASWSWRRAEKSRIALVAANKRQAATT